MPKYTAAPSPHLDDAFYAMIASHFPSLDTLPRTVLPPTSSSLHYPQGGRSIAATSSNSHSRTEDSRMNSDTSITNAGLAHSQQADCSRRGTQKASTSTYHPQPTRSGRVPIPPPEEELQAMLAMDNYFEFPSESESDDEDFVLPASELNDEDDDQEDETPNYDVQQSGPATNETGVDNEEFLEGTIDSAEYNWLMENLNALQQTPDSVPPGPHCASPNQELTAPAVRAQYMPAASPSGPDASSSGPSQAAGKRPSRARATHRSPGERSQPVVSVVDDANQQHAEIAALPRGSIPIQTSKLAAESPTYSNKTQTVMQVKESVKWKHDANSLLEHNQEREALLEEKFPLNRTQVASPTAKLELKRKRNAEQSRTFRERQKLHREATDRRIQELEEENASLRRELLDMHRRLQNLQRDDQEDMLAPSTKSKRTSTTPSRRNRKTPLRQPQLSSPSDTTSGERASRDTVANSLSFESLGKLIAGLVQTQSAASLHSEPPPSHASTTGLALSQGKTADTQNALVLLSQLVSRQ